MSFTLTCSTVLKNANNIDLASIISNPKICGRIINLPAEYPTLKLPTGFNFLPAGLEIESCQQDHLFGQHYFQPFLSMNFYPNTVAQW